LLQLEGFEFATRRAKQWLVHLFTKLNNSRNIVTSRSTLCLHIYDTMEVQYKRRNLEIAREELLEDVFKDHLIPHMAKSLIKYDQPAVMPTKLQLQAKLKTFLQFTSICTKYYIERWRVFPYTFMKIVKLALKVNSHILF
jgi:hypothetical protein